MPTEDAPPTHKEKNKDTAIKMNNHEKITSRKHQNKAHVSKRRAESFQQHDIKHAQMVKSAPQQQLLSMTDSISSQQTFLRSASCLAAAAVMATNESALTKWAQRSAITATLATHKPRAKWNLNLYVTERQTLLPPMTDSSLQGMVPQTLPATTKSPMPYATADAIIPLTTPYNHDQADNDA